MINREKIQELADRIGREFTPARVILFGSYAYGTPTADSDVDLLVILPFEGKALHKAVEILDRVKPTVPVDLLVRTPQEVEARVKANDFFLQEILEKGQVLCESAHA